MSTVGLNEKIVSKYIGDWEKMTLSLISSVSKRSQMAVLEQGEIPFSRVVMTSQNEQKSSKPL